MYMYIYRHFHMYSYLYIYVYICLYTHMYIYIYLCTSHFLFESVWIQRHPHINGNTLDGDGCSSTCFVEEGFTCKKTGSGPCIFSATICFFIGAYIYIYIHIYLRGSGLLLSQVQLKKATSPPLGLSFVWLHIIYTYIWIYICISGGPIWARPMRAQGGPTREKCLVRPSGV